MPRAVVGPDPRTGSRALFAFAGGWGHLTPLLPLAEALRAAGWRVAFAGEEVVARRAEKWGEVFGFPSSHGGADRAVDPRLGPMNLEVLGNADAIVHAHVWPRYEWEPAALVTRPVWFHEAERWHDPATALGPEHDGLRERIATELDALVDEDTLSVGSGSAGSVPSRRV